MIYIYDVKWRIYNAKQAKNLIFTVAHDSFKGKNISEALITKLGYIFHAVFPSHVFDVQSIVF